MPESHFRKLQPSYQSIRAQNAAEYRPRFHGWTLHFPLLSERFCSQSNLAKTPLQSSWKMVMPLSNCPRKFLAMERILRQRALKMNARPEEHRNELTWIGLRERFCAKRDQRSLMTHFPIRGIADLEQKTSRALSVEKDGLKYGWTQIWFVQILAAE